MAAFKMSKWYLGCVTPAGDASMAYTGALSWGPVRLHYPSLLESSAGSLSNRYFLRPQSPTRARGPELVWESTALGIEGEWMADSDGLRETIYSCQGGSVDWHCVVPGRPALLGNRTGSDMPNASQ